MHPSTRVQLCTSTCKKINTSGGIHTLASTNMRLMKRVKKSRTGSDQMALMVELARRRIIVRLSRKMMAERTPAIIGEKNQLRTTGRKPLENGKSPFFSFHNTPFPPPNTSEKPMTEPTVVINRQLCHVSEISARMSCCLGRGRL